MKLESPTYLPTDFDAIGAGGDATPPDTGNAARQMFDGRGALEDLSPDEPATGALAELDAALATPVQPAVADLPRSSSDIRREMSQVAQAGGSAATQMPRLVGLIGELTPALGRESDERRGGSSSPLIFSAVVDA